MCRAGSPRPAACASAHTRQRAARGAAKLRGNTTAQGSGACDHLGRSRGRARRYLPRPRRRTRTDWRRAAPVPPARGGHRGPAPPGTPRCPGSRGSAWGGRVLGEPDGSSPRQRGGRAEGSLSSSGRAARRQQLRGGRRQRWCMRPAGGGVPGRQRDGAEQGQRNVMRS